MALEGSHTLCQALQHAWMYRNHHWICDALQGYQQYACDYFVCNNCIRTYCACRPGVWLYDTCHVCHVLEEQECGN
jgi:hypothetical protein